MDDTSKILEAAKFDALRGYEGYSAYDSYEVFVTLNDPRIGLSELQIAHLGTVTAAILSGGPGTQQAVSKGEWPLILNQDSWFRFLITVLAGAAHAGARFKDLPSRGDHTFNMELASLPLSDELTVPVTQTEMVKRLLEQLYAQFDKRNDYEALRERAKSIQDIILSKFEWLICARVGAKCAFLSEYFFENGLKDIMECILLEEPRPELTEFIRKTWRKQGTAEAEKERGRVVQAAYQEAIESFATTGHDLAAAHAGTSTLDKGMLEVQRDARMRELAAKHDRELKDLEIAFADQYRVRKQEQTQWYNQLEEADQAAHIHKEVLAMGLLEHEELQGHSTKQVKTVPNVCSSSIISVRKRGRLVSRSEDIEYINKFTPSHSPPPKVKDGSITPTKASIVECALPVLKEPAPSSMMVDEPVTHVPIPISSTTIPLPPVQAESTPVVFLADPGRPKSPSPSPSEETFNRKLNENFGAINDTLLAIMKCLEQLEARSLKSPSDEPPPEGHTAKSPLPPRIPATAKGKGRAKPAIPLPSTKPTTAPSYSPMVLAGTASMRAAGASDEDIAKQVQLTEKDFPSLPKPSHLLISLA